jgi:hypothetical protein
VDYIKIQVQAMEDYNLVIKQDIVYDEAVEQAPKIPNNKETTMVLRY